MELRQELLPPALSPKLLSKLEVLFDVIHNSHNVDSAIKEFNELTGKEYDRQDFFEYYEYTSTKHFIEVTATPEPPKVYDISRNELVEIVNRIMSSKMSKRDLRWYRNLLYRNVAHPTPTNIIFQNKQELTAEEIIDEILAYKPIVL